MNWIDEKIDEFVDKIGFVDDSIVRVIDTSALRRATITKKQIVEMLITALQEAHTQGAQEALAKVEEWVRRNKKSWIDGEHVPQEAVIADDLLHHLQQLKDSKYNHEKA